MTQFTINWEQLFKISKSLGWVCVTSNPEAFIGLLTRKLSCYVRRIKSVHKVNIPIVSLYWNAYAVLLGGVHSSSITFCYLLIQSFRSQPITFQSSTTMFQVLLLYRVSFVWFTGVPCLAGEVANSPVAWSFLSVVVFQSVNIIPLKDVFESWVR